MNVALPALASFNIEFEIGISTGRGADVIERCGGERRASEIRVEDHAGGIYERQQRVTQRLAKWSSTATEQTAQREAPAIFRPIAWWQFPGEGARARHECFPRRGEWPSRSTSTCMSGWRRSSSVEGSF
jgi:hypothetical protein